MKKGQVVKTTHGTDVVILEELIEGKEFLVEAHTKRYGCYVTQVKIDDLKDENSK